MKILVLGATGMAGHIISFYFIEKGYSVDNYSRTLFPYGNHVTGDLFNLSDIKLLINNQYDVIINAIGILNHQCDLHPEQAIFINSFLPHYIVSLLKNTTTKFIHLSTDCIFSGHHAPYSENSIPDGLTVYDRTKALGEINHDRHLTFRNSIIGPEIKTNGIGLFHWFMKQQSPISGYRAVFWNGVTTLTLAQAIEQAILFNISGLYQLVPEKNINKYDLLNLFNVHFKKNSLEIEPVDHIILDKTLVNNRQDFNFIVPDYEQMITDMKGWITEHKHLYPHYEIS